MIDQILDLNLNTFIYFHTTTIRRDEVAEICIFLFFGGRCFGFFVLNIIAHFKKNASICFWIFFIYLFILQKVKLIQHMLKSGNNAISFTGSHMELENLFRTLQLDWLSAGKQAAAFCCFVWLFSAGPQVSVVRPTHAEEAFLVTCIKMDGNSWSDLKVLSCNFQLNIFVFYLE